MPVRSTRFIFGRYPFQFIAAHLVHDEDFLEGARQIVNLDADSYSRLVSQLANADGFLSRADLTKIVGNLLGNEADSIATAINLVASIVHDTSTNVEEAMKQVSEVIEEKVDFLQPDQRHTLAERLQKLVAEPAGIAKQQKARQLVDAIGPELDEFRIICDIRPIFDKNRERIDGAIPITTLRLEIDMPDGDASVVEMRISEKQIDQLASKFQDAKLKLSMIKSFLNGSRLAIPKTNATIAENQ